MQQSKNKSPIFIVGAGRSGTTLLRQILNCHPSLAIVPESHFIPWFYNKLDTYGNLSEKPNALSLINQIVSTDRFQKWSLQISNPNDFYEKYKPNSYKNILMALYQEYAVQHGKPRWGDKTPAYVDALDILLTIFPSAQIIHLVRDGRDVYLSHKKVTWGPKTAESTAMYWVNCLQNIAINRSLNESNLLEVRYEDLVTEPESQLKRICAFLNEEFYTHLLNYQNYARNDVRHWKSQYFNKKITPQIKKYLIKMEDTKIRSFERIAAGFLKKYGYQIHHDNLSNYSSLRLRLFLIEDALMRPIYSRLNHSKSRIGYGMRFFKLDKIF